MTDRDYERAERRRRTREKGKITSIIAVGVIVLALIAIIVVVIAVIGKNQPAAEPAATEAATELPTLYVAPMTSIPTERATAAVTPTVPHTETEAAWDDPDDRDDSDDNNETQGSADTSNNSSANVAGALHYYAYGGTSGGYNWTYDSMGDTAVTCQYDFDEGKYDFSVTGLSPGETSLTIIYYAADDQPVEVPLSVRVNDDLSVDML